MLAYKLKTIFSTLYRKENLVLYHYINLVPQLHWNFDPYTTYILIFSLLKKYLISTFLANIFVQKIVILFAFFMSFYLVYLS